MECKLRGRERPVRFFPKRVIEGTGQVWRVCVDCDHENIQQLAEKVAEKLDIEVSADAYLSVRRK